MPAAFTLIVPYYRNMEMLRWQIAAWREYPACVHIVLVDDGSPEPARDIVLEHAPPALRSRIALYRIQVDIPWNRGGARNLGAHAAKTDWIVHVDVDHVLPPASAIALTRFTADPRHWYRFERYRVGKADETRKKDAIADHVEFGQIHPHMDSYLVTRAMYWKVGGYDEDYSGCLGGGSPFVKALSREAAVQIAPGQIALHVFTRSKAADASDNTLSRDREEYARRRRLKDAGGKTKPTNPIRFPWIQQEL